MYKDVYRTVGGQLRSFSKTDGANFFCIVHSVLFWRKEWCVMNSYITWSDFIQLAIAAAAWTSVIISLRNSKKK